MLKVQLSFPILDGMFSSSNVFTELSLNFIEQEGSNHLGCGHTGVACILHAIKKVSNVIITKNNIAPYVIITQGGVVKLLIQH